MFSSQPLPHGFLHLFVFISEGKAARGSRTTKRQGMREGNEERERREGKWQDWGGEVDQRGEEKQTRHDSRGGGEKKNKNLGTGARIFFASMSWG